MTSCWRKTLQEEAPIVAMEIERQLEEALSVEFPDWHLVGPAHHLHDHLEEVEEVVSTHFEWS